MVLVDQMGEVGGLIPVDRSIPAIRPSGDGETAGSFRRMRRMIEPLRGSTGALWGANHVIFLESDDE
jgi:hypothetical protein